MVCAGMCAMPLLLTLRVLLLPVNVNRTHSLSPCPRLDDLHMNRSLRQGCSNSPHTHRHIRKHTSVWVYRHTPVQMLAPSPRFRFQETSVLCKKTNGYLFNCYPQMRKYPSSSPHDDFPSKVSSRLEFSPHTPLTLSLHLSFSLSVPLFLIHCFHIYSHRHTDT